VPLPNAQEFPAKVNCTLKTFFPDARGVAIPVVVQLKLPEIKLLEILPLAPTTTDVACGFIVPVTACHI